MMKKWTTEEALRLAFEDWSIRQIAANLKDGETFTVTLPLKFPVPAAYAKAILKDVMAEESLREVK